MKPPNQNDDSDENDEIFCTYCKEQVLEDELVVKRKKPYHKECWKLEHNHIDELKF